MDSKKSGTPESTSINVNKNPAAASTTTTIQHKQPAVKDDKPLDELLDFIEGNR